LGKLNLNVPLKKFNPLFDYNKRRFGYICFFIVEELCINKKTAK